MDAYLADIKEAIDQMEEVDVGLLGEVIVYHTLKNLPSKFDMIKQVIFNERKPPTYLELESRLLIEEMSCKNCVQERENKALVVTYRFSFCRPFNRRSMNQGRRTGGYHQSRPHNPSTVYHGYQSGRGCSGNSHSGDHQ